ncbi:hypothetical protein HDC32_000502 [Pseudomonas sp. JAI120]|nr:hypothetical protein [Pseudomonas sp. SJZ073]MBB6310833.1 hypothetical protein [Pseudomonas sp. JAI120]
MRRMNHLYLASGADGFEDPRGVLLLPKYKEASMRSHLLHCGRQLDCE